LNAAIYDIACFGDNKFFIATTNGLYLFTEISFGKYQTQDFFEGK